MAAEKRDLAALIKQRKQRPSFSRMISWEFSHMAELQEQGSRKQKRKKKTRPECSEEAETEPAGDSEGSSEYDTACEEESEILALSSSPGSDSTHFDSLSESFASKTSLLNEPTDQAEDENVFDDATEQGVGIAECRPAVENRGRKLSKRQKRKRKDEMKTIFANEFLSMGDLCDMDNEIDGLFNAAGDEMSSANIQRAVPTLVEICLAAARKKSSSHGQKSEHLNKFPMPPGLKHIARSWGSNLTAQQNQLSFILNKILSHACYKSLVSLRLYDEERFFFPLRCIWTHQAYPTNKDEAVSQEYPSEMSAAYLFTPTNHKIPHTYFNYDLLVFYENYHRTLPAILSVYANCVDLMLPGTVSDIRKAPVDQSQADILAYKAKAATFRVRNALKLRFPGLTDPIFDLVIPYVMWGRGKVAVATEMFRSLVDKETDCRNKAMYLSEVARMYAWYDDTTLATKFYKLASEIALSELKGGTVDKAIQEVTEQTQVLIASLHDNGVFSTEKAVLSSNCWAGARNLPNAKPATIIASIDSFLCYHAAHWTESNWLDEAYSRLESSCKALPYLKYYMCMIRALQGQESDSRFKYKDFRVSSLDQIGSDIMRADDMWKKLWQPLTDVLKNQKSPVKPLRVIWRRQLQPTCVADTRPIEAQCSSRDLNLHLNSSGLLSGDMQMLLPPMRNVTLDPFSGALVLNKIPSDTGMWQTAFFKVDDFLLNAPPVPTPVLIFQHDDGTTLHMIAPDNSYVSEDSLTLPICPFMLYWKGPKGETAKLNLFKFVKDFIKEDVLKEVKKMEGSWTKTMKETVYNYVDMAYNKNQYMECKTIVNAANKKEEEANKVSKKKASKDFNRKSKTFPCSLHLCLQLFSEPFSFKKTVVLHLKVTSNKSFKVFINTSDKFSFLEPRLHNACHNKTILEQGFRNQSDADFSMNYEGARLQFYNENGVCQELDISDLKKDQHPNSTVNPVLAGSLVFGLNRARTSVWKHLLGDNTDGLYLEEKVTWSLAPYWTQLADTSIEQTIYNLLAVGTANKGKGKLILVVMSIGLAFMDPDSMELVPIEVAEEFSENCRLSDDGKVLVGDMKKCKLLEQTDFVVDGQLVYRGALRWDNRLFVFDVSRNNLDDLDTEVKVTVQSALMLQGKAKDMCFIGQGELLVSLSQHKSHNKYYREHVFHYDLNGHLYGVLLCLGKGRRSFFPVFHSDTSSELGRGWYVYMRDGHSGIICVKLHS